MGQTQSDYKERSQTAHRSAPTLSLGAVKYTLGGESHQTPSASHHITASLSVPLQFSVIIISAGFTENRYDRNF